MVEAQDVRSCEDRCLNARNFDCRSFSFKFMAQPYRNCELSDDTVRGSTDDALEYDQVSLLTYFSIDFSSSIIEIFSSSEVYSCVLNGDATGGFMFFHQFIKEL